MNVLFLCTGNINRSPAAELILKDLNSVLQVDSCGVSDYNKGKEMAKPMQKALDRAKVRTRYIPVSKPLTQDLIDWSDVILYMTERHLQRALQSFPTLDRKKFLNLARYNSVASNRIPDPHGKSTEIYDSVVKQLRICCNNFNKEINDVTRNSRGFEAAWKQQHRVPSF